MPFVAQIRGSYVLDFVPQATVPKLSDVLADPHWQNELVDGDVVVIGDETAVPPTIISQSIYQHPAPMLSPITGPR